MASFTCISCMVSFKDPELQRSHYKSDWHRYNLKRKVAELPPISFEDFQRKLVAQRQEAAKENESHVSFCQVCNKAFSSLNTFNNHLRSKKHKLESEKPKVTTTSAKTPSKAKSGKIPGATTSSKSPKSVCDQTSVVNTVKCTSAGDSEDDEWEDVEEEEILGDCSSDEQDDVDDESLPPNYCLFCPHVEVDVEQNVKHMTRVHSFFIPDIDYLTDVAGLMTYLGAKVGNGKICLYCNKRSRYFPTLESVRMHMMDKGHCKLAYDGDMALEYSDFYDFSASYPAEEGTNGSDEVSERFGSLDIDDETMELVLPSGTRLGHRAFKVYYNQSLPPEHLRHSKATTTRIGTEYRALGWHGTMAVDVKRKMVVMRKINQQKRRSDVKLQVKANKFQPHLRPQVVF